MTDYGYVAGPYIWQNAFENRNKKNKHLFVAQRKGRDRYPLDYPELIIFGRVAKKVTNATVGRIVNKDIRIELHRELSFRLKRVMER